MTDRNDVLLPGESPPVADPGRRDLLREPAPGVSIGPDVGGLVTLAFAE